MVREQEYEYEEELYARRDNLELEVGPFQFEVTEG